MWIGLAARYTTWRPAASLGGGNETPDGRGTTRPSTMRPTRTQRSAATPAAKRPSQAKAAYCSPSFIEGS